MLIVKQDYLIVLGCNGGTTKRDAAKFTVWFFTIGANKVYEASN